MILHLLAALALTIGVEGAAMFLLSRRWRFAYYSLLCNLLTNPLLNLILLLLAPLGGPALYYGALAVLELAVCAGEGLLYAKLCGWPLRRALPASLGLNALSFIAGLLVFGL